uniref:Uncharacterized protein n=1 Tax=Magnetococcus massalia (strain MO-1) TaxID=451514 RepID=A0A1S7LKD6_MAGMO|nr:Conserved exported protein of unknown function [Candidatus Magnetococcus massalia]
MTKKPVAFMKPAVLGIAAAVAIAAAQPAPAKADAAGIATVVGAVALAGVLYHASQPLNAPRYGVNRYLTHPRGYGRTAYPQGYVPRPAMPVRYVSTQPANVYASTAPQQQVMRYRTVGVPVVMSEQGPIGMIPLSVNAPQAPVAPAAPAVAK